MAHQWQTWRISSSSFFVGGVSSEVPLVQPQLRGRRFLPAGQKAEGRVVCGRGHVSASISFSMVSCSLRVASSCCAASSRLVASACSSRSCTAQSKREGEPSTGALRGWMRLDATLATSNVRAQSSQLACLLAHRVVVFLVCAEYHGVVPWYMSNLNMSTGPQFDSVHRPFASFRSPNNR